MWLTWDFVRDFYDNAGLPPCPYCQITESLKPTFSSENPLLRKITGYICQKCGGYTALADLTGPDTTDPPTLRPAA